jgi:2-polyprenyl-3-methyl-5-hydroxy-6-metoxy-1,4-benzoquinol methylase
MPGSEALSHDDALDECVELYSEHYGTWGERGVNPGEPVRTTRERLAELLDGDAAWLARAFADGALIGYCVAVKTEMPGRGPVAWVSQLVVHTAYRKARVATTLLYSVWHFSDCYAWGLATANPFAIRALETATRRPCRAAMITRHGPELLAHLEPHVPYLPTTLLADAEGRPLPRVDTEFFLDHGEISNMQARAARYDRPWALGQIDEGEEWLGCTFAEQRPHALDDRHLADLLTGADGIWIQAYEGMTLDEAHSWHRHATDEIDLVVEVTGIESGAAVLDVGCGDGRHVEVLSERGFDVTGVDISEDLIARARDRIGLAGASFEVADARKSLPSGEFDLAICLYDVIGSSARPDDDLVLVRNMAAKLAPGGFLVAGLMNTAVTLPKLPPDRRPETNVEFIEALEALRPSSTMETTGSVFDPELLLHYNGVYYRKEQFQRAGWRLPAELVVRDRRFTAAEAASLMQRAGLEVLDVRPVQAGSWDRQPPLAADDPRAKELLVVARRSG